MINSTIYGYSAQITSAFLFVCQILALKSINLGLIYEITLMMLALALPSICIIYYYNTTQPKHRLALNTLFTNPARLFASLVQAVNFVLLYSGFKLLPMIVSIPYYFLFGLSAVVFAYFVNHEKPNLSQVIAYLVILIGTCLLSFYNITLDSKTIVGLFLLTICIVLFSFNVTFMKPTFDKSLFTLASNTIYEADEKRPTLMISSIQLLEMSTITFVLTAIIILAFQYIPKLIPFLNKCGVPDTITDLSTGQGWTTVAKMFGLFLVFAYTSNALRFIADDYLNTDLYSGGEYFNVFFAILVGIFAFHERISTPQIIGLIIIIGGALFITYQGIQKALYTPSHTNQQHITKTSSKPEKKNIRWSYMFHSIK